MQFINKHHYLTAFLVLTSLAAVVKMISGQGGGGLTTSSDPRDFAPPTYPPPDGYVTQQDASGHYTATGPGGPLYWDGIIWNNA